MTAAGARAGYAQFTADGPFRSALTCSPDFILILDLAGKVRFANPKGLRALGANGEADVLGKDWASLWAEPDRAAAQAAFEAAVDASTDGEARFMAPAPGEAGQRPRLDNVLSPLRDPAGAAVAVLVISRDVTELEEQAHLAAAQKSALVRSAAEMARLVGLEIDFRRNRVVQVRDVSDPEHREDTIERTLEIYAPEDRARIRNLLERARLYGEPYRFDAPFNAPDGARGWVRVFSEPVYEDGVCVGVRGAGMDITDEVAAQESLRSAEQRLRIAVELAGLEVYEFDIDEGRLVRGNSSPSIFDSPLQPEDFHLMESINLVDPQDRARVEAEWTKALEMRLPFRSEFRLRLGGDREVWVYCVAETFQERGRPRRLVTALMDITERKCNELQMIATMARMREHEAQQKLLLDELNHRVKNTLASVQSIAVQTLTDIHALADARDLFVERLLALSSAHNLLVKHAWASTSFQELVDVMLKPYGRPYRFTGPDLRLDPNFVVSLGMALHELATNALNHGAWRSGGRVAVAVAIDQGEAQITWRESGGPRVSPPDRRGFGSRLLERGVARELRATVSLAFEPQGLVCDIRVPLGPRLLPIDPAEPLTRIAV